MKPSWGHKRPHQSKLLATASRNGHGDTLHSVLVWTSLLSSFSFSLHLRLHLPVYDYRPLSHSVSLLVNCFFNLVLDRLNPDLWPVIARCNFADTQIRTAHHLNSPSHPTPTNPQLSSFSFDRTARISNHGIDFHRPLHATRQ